MNPWAKIVLVVVWIVTLTLVSATVYRYLFKSRWCQPPDHLTHMHEDDKTQLMQYMREVIPDQEEDGACVFKAVWKDLGPAAYPRYLRTGYCEEKTVTGISVCTNIRIKVPIMRNYACSFHGRVMGVEDNWTVDIMTVDDCSASGVYSYVHGIESKLQKAVKSAMDFLRSKTGT